MKINWNKFPDTEPRENFWSSPCLIVVEYMQDNQLQKRIQPSYFLTGYDEDTDECSEFWEDIDDDERVTHWVYIKDISLPNNEEPSNG